VLTDNGSEFMKHFDKQARRLYNDHWHAIPKTAKMNSLGDASIEPSGKIYLLSPDAADQSQPVHREPSRG